MRRAGGVVLGLDHYCYWLGTPVGHGNRKLFILFVVYSAIFCVIGSLHTFYDLMVTLPDEVLPPNRQAPPALMQFWTPVRDALYAMRIGDAGIRYCNAGIRVYRHAYKLAIMYSV